MLIRLFCRVKTLLITTSNYIVEIRLQTIEIKKTHWFSYFSSPKKRILTSARDFPRPPARPPLASPFFMVVFASADYDLRIL